MRLYTLFALLAVSAALVFGQVGNGTITGTVLDPAGAVVAGAAVEARNSQTGVAFPGVTTNAGNYTISDLPIGTYTVTVKVQGFKTYTHTNLALAAAQVLREDAKLEVGAATESVTVTAEASLLKTETGELATNVNTEALDALPLVGIGTVNSGTSGYRNPYNSILTLPGVSGYSASGTFQINGLGQSFVTTETMRTEGQDATSRLFAAYDYTQMAQPSVDAVQEIAYQTSNYAPEFGQAGSVVINMTMKSGTNQYHGTGYDYFVNEDLNAGQPFTRSGGCLTGNGNAVCSSTGGSGGKYRPRARRNDFGGTLGGPIVIPKIYNGRNKTFFFFNYEEFLETNNYGFNDTVPTAAYLKGDFSAISPNGNCSACALLGIQQTALGSPQAQLDPIGNHVFANEIFDPSTRAIAPNGQGYALPFQNNMIPANRFDPVALKVLSFVPGANNSNFLGNYVVNEPGNRYSAIPAFKIDHNISTKDKLSFYYSENTTANQFNPTLGTQDGFPNSITGARGSFITNYQERLNYDRTLTPSLLLHIGAGLYHQSFVDNSPGLNFNPQQTLGLSGFLENRTFPQITGNCTAAGFGAPPGCTNATGGLQTIGVSIQGPSYEMRPTGTTSVTWVRGKHTYKAGAEWIDEQSYSKPHPTVILNSGTAATSDPFVNTNSYGSFSPGFGFASFLLGDLGVSPGAFGALTQPTSQGAPLDTRFVTYDWALYLQDSWKITRKLTLDYGVRWDYDTPDKEQYGRWGQINATLANPVAGGRLGALQFASNCNCNFYKSAYPFALGPRIGVAYQIDPKTVFRAGWGINYQFVQDSAGTTVSSPGTFNTQLTNPSYVPILNQYVNIETPGVIQSPRWPVTNPFQYPNPGATSPAPTVPDANINRPPRINQWSVGFQREITKSFVMEASYVANRAVWLNGDGSLGILSQLSPQFLATYGLYPIPGTGPAGYNNNNDRILLTDTLSNPAVVQRFGNLLPYSGFPTSSTLANALVPFPQFGAVEPTGSATGNSKYDSLQVKATKRFSHGLVAGGSYTWGQGFIRATRQDVYNPNSSQWALQNIPPQNLNFNATYTVPKAGFLPKYVNAISKDWQLGFFANYQSGSYLTPPTSTVNANYLSSEEVRVPGQPLYTPGVNINDLSTYNPYFTQVLNPNAWQACPSNSVCTAGGTLYKDFRAPRTPTENANIARNFRLGKEGKYILQIRGEFVNIFNRTIMPAPSSTSLPQTAPSRNSLGIYNGGFGVINAYLAPSTGYAPPTMTTAPYFEGRQGTLIARFSF
ncbi:MAG TPA: TonB-dependent receptor [Bryobacteraceae bacterium]